METEAAFFRQIVENRNDVGPRLTFADWLEERGDPWADLIRIQCDLATTRFYANGDEYGRGGPPFFDDPTRDAIVKCEVLLSLPDATLNRTNRLVNAAGFTFGTVKRWTSCDGNLIWWRQNYENDRPIKLFWWKGFPERAIINFDEWFMFHDLYMQSFPLWFLSLDLLPAMARREGVIEDAIELVAKYVGLITTLDVPMWAPVNGFTAWTCRLLQVMGEKCHEQTGKPFTLKIGQAVMGGPPHSASERWNRHVESWLKNDNVRIIHRLEARPAGELMPSGIRG